jgi:hypothetical protein
MQENSIIKKNILKFIEYKGISKYKFYQKTGITRGILGQNNGMSEENTAKFLAYFPEIDANWLLTGEGEMLKSISENGNQLIAGNTIQGNNNKINGLTNVDNRKYYNDLTDVLLAQMEDKERLLSEKDERLHEKDDIIKDLRDTIKDLREVISELKK